MGNKNIKLKFNDIPSASMTEGEIRKLNLNRKSPLNYTPNYEGLTKMVDNYESTSKIYGFFIENSQVINELKPAEIDVFYKEFEKLNSSEAMVFSELVEKVQLESKQIKMEA